MAKIILTDGSEEILSPAAARAKVIAGEAKWPTPVPHYSTRQMVAEKPRQVTAEIDKDIDDVFAEEVKPKRKRRTKAEMEADASAAESDEESV